MQEEHVHITNKLVRKTSVQAQKCKHCGLSCETLHITLPINKVPTCTLIDAPSDNFSITHEKDENTYEQAYFCCEGCKTVYQILHQNQLTDYYAIASDAGITTSKNSLQQFTYLDNEDIRHKLLDFSNGKVAKITFYIPQMHCAACIWLLEKLYDINEAIHQSKVNFLKKELYLTFDETKLHLSALVHLLSSIGYEPQINLSTTELSQENKWLKKDFYFKLGVAGFCFGNIMLLSFPEYLGLNKLQEYDFYTFFGYLNILLILPVLLYSASPYFKNAWQGVKQQKLHIDVPIVMGIMALFSRSVYDIITHTGAGYLDSLAGLVFFLLIGKWFQQATYQHFSFERDYKSYFPLSARLKTSDGEQSVPLAQLAEGDTIIVRNHEIVPADAVLMKGKAYIDYSFVTGETAPVSIAEGKSIWAGGKQKGSSIELQLTKVVSQSYLTQLWNQAAFKESESKTDDTLTHKVATYFTPTIIVIACLATAYWYSISDVGTALQVFTAVLIIACPCALALAAPFTLGNALRLLSKHQFYLKNISVVEQLAKVSHIVFDKTGTITHADKNLTTTKFVGDTLSEYEQQMVKTLVTQSQHPISQQIEYSVKSSRSLPITDFIEHISKGIEAKVNNTHIKIGSAKWLNVKQVPMPGKKCTYLSIDGLVRGYYETTSAYRAGLNKLIQQLEKNYELSLISGDNMAEYQNLLEYFDASTPMLFEQCPQDKLNYIKKLQKSNSQLTSNRVLMLGDGLNDAGALKQANVGIAISENVNNFSPACDAILSASEFDKLHTFLKFTNQSLSTVKWALGLSFCYNIVGLSFAVQGLLSPLVAAILMPLSSISVVIFGVLCTQWLARKI